MKDNNELAFVLIIALLVVVILGLFIMGTHTRSAANVIVITEETSTNMEESNGCGSGYPCFCRDTCEKIYGHSEWESWIHKENGECWCIEQNTSRRVF